MASTRRSDGDGSYFVRHRSGCDRPTDARARFTCSCPWQGVLVTGWREGKPVRKKVTAKSEPAAKVKIRELRAKLEAGEVVAGPSLTVERWMTYWLEQIAADKVRPSTLRGYRTSVSQYIVPLLGHRRLDKLSPEDVERAWKHLTTVGRPGAAKPRPLSSTSAHQAHRALARALRVAQQRGLVRQNVAKLIDAPQPNDVEMQVLDLKQAEAVLMAAAGDERNAARWRVALTIGLRQGEALGLTWEHVDLDAGTIAVRKALARVKGEGLVFGPVKSRAGKRVVPLPAKLLAQMKAHRSAQAEERLAAGSWWQDHDLVFAREDGRPIDPRADWADWRALCARAGVPAVRLHDARHSAATMMLAAGIPQRVVMEILGHSQISITQRYQHVLDEMQKDAAAKLDAYWG